MVFHGNYLSTERGECELIARTQSTVKSNPYGCILHTTRGDRILNKLVLGKRIKNIQSITRQKRQIVRRPVARRRRRIRDESRPSSSETE
jgi:hypothetical protein